MNVVRLYTFAILTSAFAGLGVRYARSTVGWPEDDPVPMAIAYTVLLAVCGTLAASIMLTGERLLNWRVVDVQ